MMIGGDHPFPRLLKLPDESLHLCLIPEQFHIKKIGLRAFCGFLENVDIIFCRTLPHSALQSSPNRENQRNLSDPVPHALQNDFHLFRAGKPLKIIGPPFHQLGPGIGGGPGLPENILFLLCRHRHTNFRNSASQHGIPHFDCFHFLLLVPLRQDFL